MWAAGKLRPAVRCTSIQAAQPAHSAMQACLSCAPVKLHLPSSCPACPLCAAGLSLLNISLDTLQPDRFVMMTRRQGHERVLASIWKAAELGFDPGRWSLCACTLCW